MKQDQGWQNVGEEGMGTSAATDLADRTPRARTAPAAVTVC
jgi:hypothetical protein